MNIYTRRTLPAEYLGLQATQRTIQNKRRPRRSGLRVATYVGLGLVSAGLLAGLLAIALRRRNGDAIEDLGFEGESEIVGEYVTAPEPTRPRE